MRRVRVDTARIERKFNAARHVARQRVEHRGELRVAGGRGAGRVQRLGPGHYALGSGRDTVLPLDDPGVPPVVAYLDVDIAGQVRITPEPSIVGVTRPAPGRITPLPGPIVVPRDATGETSPKRRRRGLDPVDDQENIDPQAPVPLVHLDRRPLTTPTGWPPGAALVVGDLLL
ncbi:hypothetical protein GNZ12_25095, partial [Paraburkholderia sp. 1N]|nr:hypothetical protein [Paraburkholderia solitsugae]